LVLRMYNQGTIISEKPFLRLRENTVSNRLKDVWYMAKDRGENIGLVFIILGVLLLLAQFALVLSGVRIESGLLGASLGLLSVGLGFIAVGMSSKSDKKYSEILNRVDTNIVQILSKYKTYEGILDTIEEPVEMVTVKVEPSSAATDLRGKVTVGDRSRAAAQKRLDEDTKRVGFVRGEVYQLEDGSWGIHWGGKYPL